MSQITSENTFETAIIETLLKTGSYTEGKAGDYSPELGMFKTEVLQFLKDTQPEHLISEVVTGKIKITQEMTR